jgi:hypothetical protein
VLLSACALAATIPARDSFKGTISAASGAYKGDGGMVSIAISVPASGRFVRHATFTLNGPRCDRAQHCIRVSGKLSGTITVAGPWNPDVGKRFTIVAAGSVTGLGHVRVSGSALGTGFIAQGRESLTLMLHGPAGSVTVSAQSAVVGGFTSP